MSPSYAFAADMIFIALSDGIEKHSEKEFSNRFESLKLLFSHLLN